MSKRLVHGFACVEVSGERIPASVHVHMNRQDALDSLQELADELSVPVLVTSDGDHYFNNAYDGDWTTSVVPAVLYLEEAKPST